MYATACYRGWHIVEGAPDEGHEDCGKEEPAPGGDSLLKRTTSTGGKPPEKNPPAELSRGVFSRVEIRLRAALPTEQGVSRVSAYTSR